MLQTDTEPSALSCNNSAPKASRTSLADTIFSLAIFVNARRTAASTVPVRSASNPRPFGVRLSKARRPSCGSCFLCRTPRFSSRWRIPVSVLGWTHRIAASSPAEIRGNRPTIRITRRWGPVMPKFAAIRFEVDWRPWSNAHKSRINSSPSPRRRSFPVRLKDFPWMRFVVTAALVPSGSLIWNSLCRLIMPVRILNLTTPARLLAMITHQGKNDKVSLTGLK